MTELVQKAINHIDEQAEKTKDPVSKAIAQYIIDNCLNCEINAGKVLDGTKTLAKCASSVKSNARGQAVSGCAVVEDSVVWRWVRDYYGFENMQSTAQVSVQEPISLLDFM